MEGGRVEKAVEDGIGDYRMKIIGREGARVGWLGCKILRPSWLLQRQPWNKEFPGGHVPGK